MHPELIEPLYQNPLTAPSPIASLTYARHPLVCPQPAELLDLSLYIPQCSVWVSSIKARLASPYGLI